MHHGTATTCEGARVRAQQPAQERVRDQHALQLGQVGEGSVAGEHGVHQAVEHERVEREHHNHNSSIQALVIHYALRKGDNLLACWRCGARRQRNANGGISSSSTTAGGLRKHANKRKKPNTVQHAHQQHRQAHEPPRSTRALHQRMLAVAARVP